MKAQLTSISFEGLDSGTGLATGQCDIALAGIGVTDERKEQDGIHHRLLRRQPGNPGPQGVPPSPPPADLKGVSVGAQQATSGETYAKEKRCRGHPVRRHLPHVLPL